MRTGGASICDEPLPTYCGPRPLSVVKKLVPPTNEREKIPVPDLTECQRSPPLKGSDCAEFWSPLTS